MIENVLRLLVDNRSEVRQKAGEMMSGIFHYRIVEDPSGLIVSYPVSGMLCMKLLDIYTRYSHVPQEKFKVFSSVPFEGRKSNLNTRHGGVIGLCSFINAYPYTVPPELPPLFADIDKHLRDPEPIHVSDTLKEYKYFIL